MGSTKFKMPSKKLIRKKGGKKAAAEGSPLLRQSTKLGAGSPGTAPLGLGSRSPRKKSIGARRASRSSNSSQDLINQIVRGSKSTSPLPVIHQKFKKVANPHKNSKSPAHHHQHHQINLQPIKSTSTLRATNNHSTK